MIRVIASAFLSAIIFSTPSSAAGYYLPDGHYSGLPEEKITLLVGEQFEISVDDMFCYSNFLDVRNVWGGGAEVNWYVIDYHALSEGRVRYIKSSFYQCSYDVSTKLNHCDYRSLGFPEKLNSMTSFVEPMNDKFDPVISTLLTKTQIDELKVTGKVVGGKRMLQFRCKSLIDVTPFLDEPSSPEEVKNNLAEAKKRKEYPLELEEWRKLIKLLAQ